MTVVPGAPGSHHSPQSEAVTNELQELSLQPAPNLLPLRDRKNVLQLKLQQRRTREELVSQGIMPPLKSPAAFHEQRRSLERARTEDYLKRKIRSRPERSELVRMHILEETSAEPSLQAKQLQLKRARLADDLNDKISHRPGPIELVHKNILPVPIDCLLDSPKGAGGESSSLDEDSSDALSPDMLANQDSPLGSVSALSPSDMLGGDMSPPQFISQPPPPPPPPLLLNGLDSSPQPKMTNGTPVASRTATGQTKSHSKSGSDRPPQRPKKAKDTKPKVKKLKYHQYIPPDQKAEREPPPQLDDSYAKILQQQQLFLQLQIINQQQQHYNYHTILPAPPKPPTEQPAAPNPGPSPSRSAPAATPASSNQSGASRQNPPPVGGAKPATLPANLDEFKVAELKAELKLRGLTVSGTKNDLIERLRNYQEHNSAPSANPAGQKTNQSQPAQCGGGATQPATAALAPHQSPEPAAKVTTAFSLAHSVATPGRVMRFGSTSSSPPASPSPSERSLAAMSPDETSCNGDMFGEMVSSPLTQLTLHPSPQHPGPAHHPALPLTPRIKEENHTLFQSSCALSRPPPAAAHPHPPGPGPSPLADPPSSSSSSVDKDQMLQEKDKQIEELTRMLRQKQRLVETLRSQLEQGKLGGGGAGEEAREGAERTGQHAQTEAAPPAASPPAASPPALLLPQPPGLTNGLPVRVKLEAEEGMEGVLDECQAARKQHTQQPSSSPQPSQPSSSPQCSQETLLRLQQIHRLQQQQQKTEAQMLLQQQQQLQQLIIQQTQQKQLQARQKLALLQNQAKAQSLLQAQAKAQQEKTRVQVQGKQAPQTPTQAQGQQNQQQQTKAPVHVVRQVQVQTQIKEAQQTQNQVKLSQAQQRRQLKTQRQQQKQQAVTTQQVTPVFIGQQNGSQTISLDLLKSQTTPTLVTDGNGNHYLIALTNHSADGQSGVSSLGKANGRITLQRLQSTPSKLPSQSPPQLPSTDASPKQPEPACQPIKKGQKAGLHLETNGMPEPSLPVSAPPSLQPFFDDVSDSDSQSATPPSLKREVCPPYDRHTLFTPPSPKRTSSLSIQRPKENGLSSQQMDDLFDILLKSGEISGFRAHPDPSLAHPPTPPTPSPPPSPLRLSPPTPAEPALPSQSQPPACTGSGRLEDFLESTTGAPLLGVEPDGGLTLIDDLHSQMLSSSSILLDHAPSPMDTSDLGFSPHPAEGLDFGDPTLDSMDWLDISMGGGGGGGGEGGGTNLAPLGPHTPPSVFSADFLDSTDLQLHWDSCL